MRLQSPDSLCHVYHAAMNSLLGLQRQQQPADEAWRSEQRCLPRPGLTCWESGLGRGE